MTIRLRFAVVLAAVLLPSWSLADTRVRSGEHDSFTRLVLYMPAPIGNWTASRAEDGYLVDIAPDPVALDTSEVFTFIPRTRIRDVSLRGGRVWIESDCDCHLSIFLARPDVLAIDMLDGPDPDPVAIAPEIRTTGVSLPVLFGDESQQTTPIPSLVAFAPTNPSPLAVDANALAAAVARATSGGLLSPGNDVTGLDGKGIQTRSAFDRGDADETDLAQSALCQSMSMLDGLPDISPAVAWNLIENEADPEGDPLALALAYLSLGFGVEAAAASADSDLPADTAMLFASIAHVVDGPQRSASRGLQAIRSCEGVPGLIALLSTNDGTVTSEEHGREFVATLSRLPSPLRAHIAVRLERKLEASGYSDLAQSARFAHARAVDAQPRSDRRTAQSPVNSAVDQGLADMVRLPDTPFFDPRVSGSVFDSIAAGRFEQEDRILIEAWIQEAPTMAESDAATRLYVAALNRAGRPLEALSHLDARIGRRGTMRPPIESAVRETLETAVRQLGPGALMLLHARLAERAWYDRLPREVRNGIDRRVATVRTELLGSSDVAAESGQLATVETAESDFAEPFTMTEVGPQTMAASPRRRAADAAIDTAAESIARSARLRAEAAEQAGEWMRGTP